MLSDDFPLLIFLLLFVGLHRCECGEEAAPLSAFSFFIAVCYTEQCGRMPQFLILYLLGKERYLLFVSFVNIHPLSENKIYQAIK